MPTFKKRAEMAKFDLRGESLFPYILRQQSPLATRRGAMSQHLTPVQICERIIGPPEVLGRVCGTADKSPYGWRGASANRDAGDIPSSRHMRALLAHAAAKGLPLVADDLIWGLSEDDLARRLADHAIPAGNSSASSEQPDHCGGGVTAPAAFSFQSRAGRRGAGALSQAVAPGRPGEEAPPAATFGQVAHG